MDHGASADNSGMPGKRNSAFRQIPIRSKQTFLHSNMLKPDKLTVDVVGKCVMTLNRRIGVKKNNQTSVYNKTAFLSQCYGNYFGGRKRGNTIMLCFV